MRVLVITSCTGSKRFTSPQALTQADFCDSARLQQRERELAEYRCQADRMYTGQQHLLALEGLRRLSVADISADLYIVSAGYGLIRGDRQIVPYNVTFSTMAPRAARKWAQYLRIPQAVRQVVPGYDIVFFLLGGAYLSAIDPPLSRSQQQRLVFFAAPKEVRLSAPGVVVIPAGKAQCGQYGAGYIALKGAMFRALCRGIATAPARWLEAIYADDTSRAVQGALIAGLALEGR